MPVLTINRKARYDYEVLESYQAGLVLSGKLTKAIRGKQVKPDGLFVVHQNNRLEIVGAQAPGLQENIPLLLKKKEMHEIMGRIQEKGITCVVLNFKTVGRWVKAEIGLVRGKTKRDKRETIKKRDLDREMARGLMN